MLAKSYEKFKKFLAPLLKAHNIRLAHRQYNSLRSQLVSTKSNFSPTVHHPGVYVIPCKDCPSVYVGETGRTLPIRISEHKRNVRLGHENSAPFIHVRDQDHAIDFNQANIVYRSDNRHKRLIIESALINHLNNFNLMPGVCSVDNFTKEVLFRTNPSILRAVQTAVT